MLKLKRSLVVFDVETTGTHPQVDRIVQIGIVKVYVEGQTTEWETLINPGMRIPPEATSIHGISDEDIAEAKAPTFKEIAPSIAGGLRDCDVAGYNIRFDMLFLRKEFARVGGHDVLKNAKIIDAFRIFQQHNPRSLAAAVEHYLKRKMKEGAHNALVDAQETWEVLKAQLEEHSNLPDDVDKLHQIYFESPAEGFLDAEGKIAWRFGEATLNFGKWATISLQNVARDTRGQGYLTWMVREGDFAPDVKRIITEALRGVYPRRED